MTEEAEKLYKEIKAFTLWADNNFPMWDEYHDNGEWEIGVDNHFDEMVSAAVEVISNTDFADADEVLIDAILFWDRVEYPEGSYDDEYQKIMSLHVLHKIGSMRLEEYLDKAMLTSYKYLKETVKKNS